MEFLKATISAIVSPTSRFLGVNRFRWGNRLALVATRTDESFPLHGRMQELGHLELKALGNMRQGDVPPTAEG